MAPWLRIVAFLYRKGRGKYKTIFLYSKLTNQGFENSFSIMKKTFFINLAIQKLKTKQKKIIMYYVKIVLKTCELHTHYNINLMANWNQSRKSSITMLLLQYFFSKHCNHNCEKYPQSKRDVDKQRHRLIWIWRWNIIIQWNAEVWVGWNTITFCWWCENCEEKQKVKVF